MHYGTKAQLRKRRCHTRVVSYQTVIGVAEWPWPRGRDRAETTRAEITLGERTRFLAISAGVKKEGPHCNTRKRSFPPPSSSSLACTVIRHRTHRNGARWRRREHRWRRRSKSPAAIQHIIAAIQGDLHLPGTSTPRKPALQAHACSGCHASTAGVPYALRVFAPVVRCG